MTENEEVLGRLEAVRAIVIARVTQMKRERESAGYAGPESLSRFSFLVKIDETLERVHRLIQEHGL